MNQLGYYGKISHRGDFVRFNLPQAFLKVWDDWLLQVMIHGESHSTDWASVYKNAPDWRFVLSSGIAGNTPWVGVLRASQDKVGRRFPFCLAMSLAEHALPCVSITTQAPWYDDADALLDRVLASEYTFDDLQDELAAMAARQGAAAMDAGNPLSLSSKRSGEAVTISMKSANALQSNHTLTALLDTVLRQTLGEYSVWIDRATTDTTVINAGLPVESAGLALFNSDWLAASTARIEASLLVGLPGFGTLLPSVSDAEEAVELRDGAPAAAVTDPAQKTENAATVLVPDEVAPESSHTGTADPADETTDPADEQVPSADDWAALEEFTDTTQTNTRVIVPEVEPLVLDEDDLPDTPWES